MNAEPIIQVRNLEARYNDDVILEKISCDVMAGEIFVILGGSGSGKSTLLRHMIGLQRPHAGSVVIDGVDITAGADKDIRRTLNNIGVLFQNGALLGSMTVAENIILPLREHTRLPVPSIENLVNMKLRMVGLEGYGDHLPSEISGGMRKRAALARALALNPSIVFLDEPSAGLDPVTSAGLDNLILKINRGLGMTMVIVTHELASIMKIAGRVIMLDKGEKGVIATGDPQTLSRSPDPRVRRFFSREAETSATSG